MQAASWTTSCSRQAPSSALEAGLKNPFDPLAVEFPSLVGYRAHVRETVLLGEEVKDAIAGGVVVLDQIADRAGVIAGRSLLAELDHATAPVLQGGREQVLLAAEMGDQGGNRDLGRNRDFSKRHLVVGARQKPLQRRRADPPRGRLRALRPHAHPVLPFLCRRGLRHFAYRPL